MHKLQRGVDAVLSNGVFWAFFVAGSMLVFTAQFKAPVDYLVDRIALIF